MFNDLLVSALMLVVSFGVKWFFTLIGFEVSAEVFNALVGAIVTWLIAQLGLGLTVKAFPGLVKRGVLAERSK